MKSNILKFPNLGESNLVTGNLVRIPVYTTPVSAGDPTDVPDQPPFDEFMQVPEEFLADPAHCVGHKISGDSMYPLLKDGDRIVVNTSDSARYDGYLGKVVLAYTDEGYYVKKLEKIKGNYFLVPENKKYPTKNIEEFLEFDIKGVVIGVIQFKPI